MANNATANIVVVGMGPVGMTAALSLARRGIPVTVLEAGEDLATESRASTFHPPSLEILDDLGVVDELLEVGLKAPGFQYRGHQRELIAHLDMSVLSEDTRFPFRVQCEQSKLTRIIRRHLEAMPHVTLRFGAPVERAEISRNGVNLYLPGDGFDPSIRADWVIAADGASSAVRRSLGIAFDGVTYPERFLVASTTHEFQEDFEGLAYVSYVYDPDNWGVLLRTPSHWRVLFPIDSSESDEAARTPERIEERLQGVSARSEPYPVVHSTIYAVHQRLASSFAMSRVLLAGDAAHINNPLGGMGMNSGIHDAHAAVQAIVYALDGGDPERAARTYARVRRDAAAMDVQSNTQKNYEEMRERDSQARLSRRDEMAEIAADPVRARAYLRKTSMIASFETSSRRMARGLSPLHEPELPPAGQRLSDLIRDIPVTVGALGDNDAVRICGDHDLPDTPFDQFEMTSALEVPLVVVLSGDKTDPERVGREVRRLEHAGVAGVLLADEPGRPLPPAALSAARATRLDTLVIALIDSDGDLERAVERCRALVDAGADLVGLRDVSDTARLDALRDELPDVPLVVVADRPESELAALSLELAGVGLVLTVLPEPAYR